MCFMLLYPHIQLSQHLAGTYGAIVSIFDLIDIILLPSLDNVALFLRNTEL